MATLHLVLFRLHFPVELRSIICNDYFPFLPKQDYPLTEEWLRSMMFGVLHGSEEYVNIYFGHNTGQMIFLLMHVLPSRRRLIYQIVVTDKYVVDKCIDTQYKEYSKNEDVHELCNQINKSYHRSILTIIDKYHHFFNK